jgi:prepilin-type N-terminal cleavage/methylation domain-containing protein
MQRGTRGFTLVETLMVVAIGASLAALALPAVSALSDRSGEPGELLARDLREARRLAVFRGERVAVCPIDGGADRCAEGADWSNGWQVFAEAGAASAEAGVDPARMIVQRRFAPEAATRVARLDPTARLSFAADGTLRRADATFGGARWSIRGAPARWVCLSPAGHTQSAVERGC